MEKIADEKIKNYIDELSENDNDEKDKRRIEKKLKELEERKENYKSIKEDLKNESGKSSVDSDAKKMKTGNTKGMIIGYNIQSAVDEKNKIIVDYDICNNPTDIQELYNMSMKAKETLDVKELDVLADKGYYSTEKIIKCEENNIKVYVPKTKNTWATPDQKYHRDNFKYIKEEDVYICPEGEVLCKISIKKDVKRICYRNYEACGQCENKDKCTKSKIGREITRTQKEEILEIALERLNNEKEKYNKRKAIVEHPFGTIKRAMNFNYFLLRGNDAVSAEIGMVFFSYNLKRLIKIMGVDELVKMLISLFFNENSIYFFEKNRDKNFYHKKSIFMILAA